MQGENHDYNEADRKSDRNYNKRDYHDFYDLVDSIYRITTEEEDIIDPYYGVKLMLLGLCYDIRHASMGDREVEFIKTAPEKRKTKLKNIAKRIVKRPRAYYSLEEDLFEASRLYNASVYDLRNPEHDLPENWKW
ncbi:DUF6904 family protein [Helcococcus kunzii]|uniref:DUF6904 family protein n=1 Tax=Helcococcus kunzii TaxID=40091 RepID=UPI0038B1AC97